MTITVKESMVPSFSREQVDLLKSTICRGSTDHEFELFLHACKRTGLDPFMRQIYAVKRWDSGLKRETMAIQVGIDGFRSIADKTGHYAPGKETEYEYDKEGRLFAATAYVKKQTKDGTWHEISCKAFWSEYVAKTKDGQPTSMWASKGHIMLGKCAEALALRKAFPYELSGIYAAEEMDQAGPSKSIGEEKIIADESQIEAFIAASGFPKDDVEGYVKGYATHHKISREEAYHKLSLVPAETFSENFKLWLEKFS